MSALGNVLVGRVVVGQRVLSEILAGMTLESSASGTHTTAIPSCPIMLASSK